MKRRMTRGVFIPDFFILFAVLFCWTAGADEIAIISKKTLFDREKVKTLFGVEEMLNGKNNFATLGSFALFQFGESVVVMVNVKFKNSSGKYIGIIAVVMDKEAQQWGKVSTLPWKYSDSEDSFLFDSVVIVNEDFTVFAIFAAHEREDKRSAGIADTGFPWDPVMASGTVMEDETRDDNEGSKYFDWQHQIGVVIKYSVVEKKPFANGYLKNELERFDHGKGLDIWLQNKKYVFPVYGVTKEKDNVSFTTFPEGKEDRKFPKEPTDPINCFDPVIVNWTDNKYFMITPCDNGNYRVFEVSGENDQWHLYDGMLSGVWGNNKERKGTGIRAGLASAEIGGRTVALFTQPMQKEVGDGSDYELHLWLTDMNHTYDIGQISEKGENVRASTLLYKKGEIIDEEDEDYEVYWSDKLYCLYEVQKKETKDIVFVDLTRGLKRIKKVLKGWEEVDEKILELLCSKKNDVLVKGFYSDGFTKDLVSYFTNLTEENKTWVDEYLHMNATIEKGTQVTNGLMFNGAGAGAKWEVNKKQQNRPYHFANHGFTFVATVTIHKEPTTGSSLPLLGIALNEEDSKTKRVGLCYTSKKTWSVLNGSSDGIKEIEEFREENKWEVNKSFQVAMSFKSGKFKLYVDKVSMFKDESENDMKLNSVLNISHIYIGDCGNVSTDIDVTVANVFMYVGEIRQNNFKTLCKNTVIPAEPTPEKELPTAPAASEEVTENNGSSRSGPENTTAQPGSDAPQEPTIQKTSSPEQAPPREKTEEKNQEGNETGVVSVKEESAAQSPTDNSSQTNTSNSSVKGDGQIDKRENTTPTPSSTPIPPVTGEDTQLPAHAAQPHGNATPGNTSSVTEMIEETGDGTVRERMLLAVLLPTIFCILLLLLLLIFLAFRAARRKRGRADL